MMTITETRGVQTGADRMWQVISAPGYLESCHPYCERNPVEHWPGDDAKDAIHYYGGRIVQRRFTAWLEGTGYELVVLEPAGVEQARVRWRIQPESDTSCQLSIRLSLLALDHLPSMIRWAFYSIWARRRMKRYLAAVVDGVVHYAETAEPVVRNQFGSHPWFSPAVDRNTAIKTPNAS